MDAARVDSGVLRELEPIGRLSPSRLDELAGLASVERVPRSGDPFLARPASGQSVYLLRGELALTLPDGSSSVVVGGTPEARHAIGRRVPFVAAKAITDIELVRFDDDVLDVMATWDQLGAADRRSPEPAAPSLGNWAILTGVFSIQSLRSGALSQLPTPHIEELLRRFSRRKVRAGEVLVREGESGDRYFVIETGRCEVERTVGGAHIKLAQLKPGDGFGEEALVSGAKRNATVTMLTDGALLELVKTDFDELLKAPLLQPVTIGEARQRVAAGGQWLDVRYPSEFLYDKLPGAVNIPLAEIRNAASLLDRNREYVVYCQSGRRSSAAAFLLAQRGFRATWLAGGLWVAEGRPREPTTRF
jgi:rhodanese-related sulfurtransferase